MNTRKLIALLLCLCMVLVLFSGCKKTEEKTETNDQKQDSVLQDDEKDSEIETQEDTNKPTEETQNKVDTSNKGYITDEESLMARVEELLDTSLYGDMNKSDNTSFVSYWCERSYDNRPEYDLDYKYEFGDGSVVQLPLAFAELEEEGWTLSSTNDDQELDPGYMTFGRVKNSSGKELSVAAYNHTDSKAAFKDCTVVNMDSTQYSDLDTAKKVSSAIDFTVCGSITNASTLEDIIDVLGDPTTLYCSFHYDDNGNYKYSKLTVTYMQASSAYSQLVFELSGDGNYIIEVCYDVAPE